MLCCLVCGFLRFGSTCCSHLQDSLSLWRWRSIQQFAVMAHLDHHLSTIQDLWQTLSQPRPPAENGMKQTLCLSGARTQDHSVQHARCPFQSILVAPVTPNRSGNTCWQRITSAAAGFAHVCCLSKTIVNTSRNKKGLHATEIPSAPVLPSLPSRDYSRTQLLEADPRGQECPCAVRA